MSTHCLWADPLQLLFDLLDHTECLQPEVGRRCSLRPNPFQRFTPLFTYIPCSLKLNLLTTISCLELKSTNQGCHYMFSILMESSERKLQFNTHNGFWSSGHPQYNSHELVKYWERYIQKRDYSSIRRL